MLTLYIMARLRHGNSRDANIVDKLTIFDYVIFSDIFLDKGKPGAILGRKAMGPSWAARLPIQATFLSGFVACLLLVGQAFLLYRGDDYMGVFSITYWLAWKGGHADFELEFDKDSIALLNDPPEEIPDWARLNYYKCPNCSFHSNEVDYCPAAVSFIQVLEHFKDVKADDEVEVQAEVFNRRIFMTAPARKAISSIVGLLFATSGCPYTIYIGGPQNSDSELRWKTEH